MVVFFLKNENTKTTGTCAPPPVSDPDSNICAVRYDKCNHHTFRMVVLDDHDAFEVDSNTGAISGDPGMGWNSGLPPLLLLLLLPLLATRPRRP